VELASGIPEGIDQGLLDMHVDILELDPKREFSTIQTSFDHAQLALDGLEFFWGQKTLFAKHRRMSNRAANIVLIQAVIERNTLAETSQRLIHGARKNTASG
jgi:hypothetical protein